MQVIVQRMSSHTVVDSIGPQVRCTPARKNVFHFMPRWEGASVWKNATWNYVESSVVALIARIVVHAWLPACGVCVCMCVHAYVNV
jgi:predicted phosphatase